MLQFIEVPLSGRKGSLTLLSSIRTIIGTLIRELCEILMAAPSEHLSFSSANYLLYSTRFCSALRVKTWRLMTREYTDFRKNRAQNEKSRCSQEKVIRGIQVFHRVCMTKVQHGSSLHIHQDMVHCCLHIAATKSVTESRCQGSLWDSTEITSLQNFQ